MVEQYPDTFTVSPRCLGVQSLDSSSVILRIAAEVEESQIFTAQRLMYRSYKLGFDAAGIEIPSKDCYVVLLDENGADATGYWVFGKGEETPETMTHMFIFEFWFSAKLSDAE